MTIHMTKLYVICPLKYADDIPLTVLRYRKLKIKQ